VSTLVYLLVALVLLTGEILNPVNASSWIENRSKHYSVFYQAGYEHDAIFAQHWLHQSEVLMKQKYGVIPDGYHIDLYLYPSPTEEAKVGMARNECCDKGKGGIKTGTIYYLTPSAPAWKSTSHTSSLGLPFDENFHAKVLMSEYIPIGHWTVQDSRGNGWGYYSAPEWFVQGLQEFDAIFHTTKFNAVVARERLFAKGSEISSTIQCCSSGIKIPDVYNGGALFVAFIADRFGERIHASLLRSSAPTFWLALTSETHEQLTELYKAFQEWLKYPHLTLAGTAQLSDELDTYKSVTDAIRPFRSLTTVGHSTPRLACVPSGP
jgi:hypothetical protein